MDDLKETLPRVPDDIAPYILFDRVDGQPRLLIADNNKSDPKIQSFYRRIREIPELGSLEPRFLSLPELRQLQSDESAELITSTNQDRVIGLFRLARQVGASDIHMKIGHEGLTQIQMRVHGELETVDTLEKEEGRLLASTIVLSMCDQAEKLFNETRPQDGRLAAKFLEGLNLFGARYAHIPSTFGLNVVMRIIPDDGKTPPSLAELGFLPEQQALLNDIVSTPEGELVLSGPTGSGKSTTLRSLGTLWTQMTRGKKCLFTVEDPPEGRIPGAVQTAITADRNDPEAVSQAWVRSITAAVRLDPDAILVGEMRCANSARTALMAAMTGHLVLTTLHANDPFNILERLATLDVEPDLIADPQIMIGLVSQRLVQTLCPHCSLTWDQAAPGLNDREQSLIRAWCDTDKVRFRNTDGCPHCRIEAGKHHISRGVTGRVVVAEVVRPDIHLLSLYRREGRLAARRYWHDKLQGITRCEHIRQLVNSGRVDPLAAHAIVPLDEDRVFLGLQEVSREEH